MKNNTISREISNLKLILVLLLGIAIGSFIKIIFAEAQETTSVQSVAVYRLYNETNGDHHYTTDANERTTLDRIGWNDENVAWMAPVTGSPVYRLYNSYTGEHHYTTSESERDSLSNNGWTFEGTSWNTADASGVPVYRLFNPNAKGVGSHHYTTDANEKDYLASVGWRYEGIGWYGVNTKETNQGHVIDTPSAPGESQSPNDGSASSDSQTDSSNPSPSDPENAKPSDTTESNTEGSTENATTDTTEGATGGMAGDDSISSGSDAQGSGSASSQKPESKDPIFEAQDPGITADSIQMGPNTQPQKPEVSESIQGKPAPGPGYYWKKFTHTEKRASAWATKSQFVYHMICVGCGQDFNSIQDPNAAAKDKKHGFNKRTDCEHGGWYDYCGYVDVPHATAYKTVTVTDFECWATPDGKHDPACTNPAHVVKADVDESNPIDISKVKVTGVQNKYEWDGKAIYPTPVLTYEGQVLTEDTRYIYDMPQRNKGDYHVVYYFNQHPDYWYSYEQPHLTIVGEGAFTGTIDIEFDIVDTNAKPNLMNAQIIQSAKTYTWTSSKWGGNRNGWVFNEAAPVVKLNGKVLTEGVDYFIDTKFGGTSPEKTKDGLGFAGVTITGKGAYEGSAYLSCYCRMVKP